MVSSLPVVKKKKWLFPETNEPDAEVLKAAGGSEILARLMMRRGINTGERAGAFLDPAKYTACSPMEFAHMVKAVARIARAIESKEKITVYGDYDVDGVTATSVMLTVLKQLGANVDFYIPNRATEGYGLNLKSVSVLASKQRTKLIISCDCGISNFAEINLAKSLGVETIIVDHHSMPEVLPPAVAILHPKQLQEDHPLFHLPGVGVAFKLAEALLLENKMEDEIPKLLDFVTLGMIADMVPLVQENRYLVQVGLPVLVNSPRAGIKALMDNTVKMDGTDIVGFGLAPRINAVGRLADASLAVNLMTVEDDATAQELAHQLELENARRQELCEQIFFEADLKAKNALASGEDHALALYSDTWHHGVVGIVASRLVEKYHCPVFVAELDKEEGKLKGSARGVSGIDLYQILKANEHLMTKWGGHQMAAGFSADQANADALCRALVDTCNRALSGKSRRPTLEIDLPVESQEVDLGLAKLLRKLGPFGMWNKKPVLSMQSLSVINSRPLGKEGKHHRLILRSSDKVNEFECVYWRSAGNIPADGVEIDLAFNPEVNVFNNTERLQLVLCDWRLTGEPEPPEEEEIIDFTPPQSQTPQVVHLQTQYDGKTASTSVSISSPDDPENPNNEVIETSSTPSSSRSWLGAAEPAALPGSARSLSSPPANSESSLGAAEPAALPGSMRSLSSPPANSESWLGAAEPAALPGSMRSLSFPPANSESSLGADEPAALPGSIIHAAPAPIAKREQRPPQTAAPRSSQQIQQITWKDLRNHASAAGVVDAAVRKLGDQANIFGEACKLKGHALVDRTSLEPAQHLLIWQYPPSLQVFRTLISKSQATNIYLLGSGEFENYDTSAFLKRLLAMSRFAVNQMDGQAPAEKLCTGLATTKMALALGLTLLKKVNAIDWYAEDSVIFLDILGAPPEGSWEDLAEYRQLANTLKEIREFRNWCAEAPLGEIQSELVPNSIRLNVEKTEASQEVYREDTYSRANYNDRASQGTPGQPRKG